MFVNLMLSVDDCHCTVVVLPLRVRFAGDVPAQMVLLLLAVTPTTILLEMEAD